MGYDVSWDIYLKIKDKKHIDEVKDIIEKFNKEKGYSFYLENEHILCNDPYGRYDDDEWDELFSKIIPYVEGSVEFVGEDHNHWRTIIKEGKGKFQEGIVYFGEVYESFLDNYASELPKDVLKRLDQWWTARQI